MAFPTNRFRENVTITRKAWAAGTTGAISGTTSTTTTRTANIQVRFTAASLQRYSEEMIQSPGSQTEYVVTFLTTDPNVEENTIIMWTGTNGVAFPTPIKLVCQGPAAPVYRGAFYRVSAISRK